MARRSTTPRSASASVAVRIERTHLALGIAAVAALTLVLLMLWNGVSGQFLKSQLISSVVSGHAPEYVTACVAETLVPNTPKNGEIRKPIPTITYAGTGSNSTDQYVGGKCSGSSCPDQPRVDAVKAINAAHLTNNHSCLGSNGDGFVDDGMQVGGVTRESTGTSAFNKYTLSGFAAGDFVVIEMERTGQISNPYYAYARNDTDYKDPAITIIDSTGAQVVTSSDEKYPGTNDPEHIYHGIVLRGTAPFSVIAGFHGTTVTGEGAFTITAWKNSDWDRCLAERSRTAANGDMAGEEIFACTEETCNSPSPKSCSVVPDFDTPGSNSTSSIYPLETSPKAYNLYKVSGTAGQKLDITCENVVEPRSNNCSMLLFAPNPTWKSAPIASVDRISPNTWNPTAETWDFDPEEHLVYTPTTSGTYVLMVWRNSYVPGVLTLHINGAGASAAPTCADGLKQCASASTIQTCTGGVWPAAVACPAATPLCGGTGANTACQAAAAGAVCTAGQTKCSGVQIQTCTAAGQWGAATTCTTAGQTCGGTEPTATCRAATAAATCNTNGYPAGSCTTCN